MLMYQAGCFLTAYINLCILNANSSTPVFAVPMIVNGAFAAELSLKALLTKNGIEYGREHNLFYLFNCLPDDIKLEVVNRSMEATPAFRDLQNWMNQLILISNAFEEWRYNYESGHALVLDTNYLQAFAQAVSKTLSSHYGTVDFVASKRVVNEEEIEKL